MTSKEHKILILGAWNVGQLFVQYNKFDVFISSFIDTFKSFFYSMSQILDQVATGVNTIVWPHARYQK